MQAKPLFALYAIFAVSVAIVSIKVRHVHIQRTTHVMELKERTGIKTLIHNRYADGLK